MKDQTIEPTPDAVAFKCVLLHGRYAVLTELLECVRLQAGDVSWLRYLPGPHRARRILGSPFMALLTPTERRLVGSCVAHLARVCELPLVKVSEQGRYPNLYDFDDQHTTQ